MRAASGIIMRTCILLIAMLLVPSAATAEMTVSPRVSAINRGAGRLDMGIGLAGSGTLRPLDSIRIGIFAAAIGTGFFARSPGIIADAHAAGTMIWSPAVETSLGIGASFMSARLCGAAWCGRQTGIVPSADLRIKYVVSSDPATRRSFGVVGEAAVYYVPVSVVLAGFNGRANLGLEWAFGG
ncbi:MAG TPA: hypothetical protein VFB99_23475 [Vicinamibacterales bacterium]|nr:hypothetical protein [Vicinamibacterales bacterium]